MRLYEYGLDFEAEGYFIDPDPGQRPAKSREQWALFEEAVRDAKLGLFDSIPEVVQALTHYKDYVLKHAAALFLQDAITSQGIELLHREMKGCRDPLLIVEYCHILCSFGRLSLVPVCLDFYEKIRSFNEAPSVTVSLSDMLESEPGELCLPDATISAKAYRKLVLDRCEELRRENSDESLSWFRGQLFSVPKLAEYLLQRVRDSQFEPELRQKFEAATGLSCTAFYEQGVFQPLAAAALVEDFLINGSQPYQEGIRYFFGHQIP